MKKPKEEIAVSVAQADKIKKINIKKGTKEMKRIEVNERKYYVEIDGIRLIYEDGELIGWYRPDVEVEE